MRGAIGLYHSGDLVVYGVHGVCRMLELETKLVNRKKTEYYVLSPLGNDQARFYVPTQNASAVSKLKPILDRNGVIELLSSLDFTKDVWIVDENRRKAYYKELMNSGDRGDLICMIRCLHLHRSEQFAQGRKFHLSDENFLRDAQKLIGSELSIALDIPIEEVRSFIHNTVK